VPTFFFTPHSPTPISTLSLHDALPISLILAAAFAGLVLALPLYRAIFFNAPTLVPGRYLLPAVGAISLLLGIGVCSLGRPGPWRSEEHTSELQSRFDLVCRLLLEKKK